MGVVATTVPSCMGNHRTWQCHHHVDPDGDAIRRSPQLGYVCVCIGEGKGEVSASVRKGIGWAE